MKASLVSSAYCLCCLIMLCACSNPKENSNSIAADSNKLTTNKTTAITKKAPSQPAKTPLDTIPVSLTNGKKIHLLVWEYYNFNNDNAIKDFELREADTGHSIFRAVSSQFYAEKIYRTGEIDFITIDPIYYISSKDPLEVNLSFHFYGDFSIAYLENLIGKVKYDTTLSDSEQPRMHFNFLTYKFTNDQSLVKSSIQFIPKKCEIPNNELLDEFNKFKNDTDIYHGAELAKLAFICYLNKNNPEYRTMMEQFRKSFTPSEDIHDSYPYVEYLDRFIVNLNP